LQKTVSQGGFAVVNMSDNAKITDVLHADFQVRKGKGKLRGLSYEL
jgi:hypothetical protein